MQKIDELENESHEFFNSYLETRIVEMCHPDFFENMIDACAHSLFDDCVCSEYVACDATALDTNEEYAEQVFCEFLEQIAEFFRTFMKIMGLKRRSYKNPKAHHYANLPQEIMDARILKIQTAYQPAQRTPEWYLFRHGLITASNIWKVLGSDANVNSLIYEKCKPSGVRERLASVDEGIEDEVLSSSIAATTTSVNTQSPLHWGVKYEPVTAMIYEKRGNSVLGEFGCIQHKEHAFIGASPDGVVVERNNPAYGRMLEIKNVVNREINGIPSMPYWIQMQVQMEVCDLEECDFVETVFKEYDYMDEELFYTNVANRVYEYNGVILYFIKRNFLDSSPKYVYMPLSASLDKASVDAWIDQQKQANKDDYVLFKRIYWYCEIYSCVLVHRNREWFAAALPKIRETWSIIEAERVTGCEHRLPKKKKAPVPSSEENIKCLIDCNTLE